MCCLALPIQKPGAKIHTGIIIRSDEGVGKDQFGKLISSPYGQHAITLNQNDLEDRFNPHMEGILLCIYQEIGACSGKDKHKLKNLLKHMVTGDTLRLNPKMLNGRMVENRTNFIFFTNEVLPFFLGKQGRRWLTLNPKNKKDKAYYTEIANLFKSEIGCNACHCGMVNYEIGGFSGWEEPPDTEGKTEMLNPSKDSATLLWDDFVNGDIHGIPNKSQL